MSYCWHTSTIVILLSRRSWATFRRSAGERRVRLELLPPRLRLLMLFERPALSIFETFSFTFFSFSLFAFYVVCSCGHSSGLPMGAAGRLSGYVDRIRCHGEKESATAAPATTKWSHSTRNRNRGRKSTPDCHKKK